MVFIGSVLYIIGDPDRHQLQLGRSADPAAMVAHEPVFLLTDLFLIRW
jgi:hypothetical protein